MKSNMQHPVIAHGVCCRNNPRQAGLLLSSVVIFRKQRRPALPHQRLKVRGQPAGQKKQRGLEGAAQASDSPALGAVRKATSSVSQAFYLTPASLDHPTQR